MGPLGEKMQPNYSDIASETKAGAGLEIGSPNAFVRAVSPAMLALEQVIADIAPTDIPVLLVGESGSGKDVLALQIHQLSRRRHEPFVKIGCGALAPEFFERHRQGAQNPDYIGYRSGTGTVFLDEISELEMACQSKLLHVLPDGGVSQQAWLGARVISATSRNLEEEMQTGRFREELYYRLNGVCLRLPPLRNRRDDIPVLLDFFMAKYAGLFGRPQPVLSPQTRQRLMEYSWPGNIRELENLVRKMVALGDDRAAADLASPRGESRPHLGTAQKLSLKEAARAASQQAERELILKVLTRTRWNRKRAAQDLQVSYKALLYKLKQFGLTRSTDAEMEEENAHG
jgi:DNA-binding NtrC family response regulator